MSVELPQEETKEDPLLGLDDGWKDWLRPPEMPLVNGDPSVSEDAALQNSSGATSAPILEADTSIEFKDNDSVDIKDEKSTDDGDKKNAESFNNDDTASISSVKDESSDEKKESEKNDDDNSLGYKTIPVKNYSSNFNTEDPADDIYSFYQESKLDYEKQRYHQQIFNDLVENIEEKSKFSELQSKYIEFLREAAQLETFSCSKCDYQTIIKANLKTHLWLVHKQALESNIFQCTVGSCQYKTKSLSFITKHQFTHNEESSDDFHSMGLSSDDEDYEIKEKPKKRKKMSKKSLKSLRRRQYLSCDFCPFEGDDRESLNIHMKTHMCPDTPNRFLCYKCDYGASQKSSLQQHLFRKHNIVTKGTHKFKEKQCEFCDFKTYCRHSYNIHMMKHKDPQEIKWLTCTECEFKTKHYAALRYHLKNHNLPEEQLRKYMCEVCSKKFKTKGALDVHSLRHKSISEVSKVYKCTECKFQSKFKTSLSAHMEIHRDPAFVCDICGVRSRRKYNHEMHLLTHKPDEEVEVFKCSVCTYTTKFKVSFKKHMAKGTHLGAVKRCPERKPRIRNADGTVVVDNTCDICGATLSSSGALSTHMRVHKPVELLEVFKCTQCPFETKFKGNLTAHQKKHRAPEFKCEICGLQLRTKWNHTQHLLTHKSSTECELFSCCVCSYQTKFRPYLREHLKKRHNIVTTQRPGPKPGTKRKAKPEEIPAS